MKIAILGDSHDHYGNLQKAVAAANERGCALMLHNGDLGAPGNTTDILSAFGGQIKIILGNNDGDVFRLISKTNEYENMELIKTGQAGNAYEDVIDGVRIFMHHYPRIAELAARSGEFDLCIHGHSHGYKEEQIGEAVLINPGPIIPTNGQASMVVYDTATKTTEKISL